MKETFVVGISGHRPERIGSEDERKRAESWVKDQIHFWLKKGNARIIIQGMASGTDLWSVEMASFLKIPWICAIPFKNHKPRKEDKELYDFALKNAQDVVYTSDSIDYPGPWIYQERNEYIVDNTDKMLMVWDYSQDGGTYNCFKYAEKQSKRIKVIDPNGHKEIPF